MNKNNWLIIAGIVVIFNLLMMTANNTIASSDVVGSSTNELKQVNRHVEKARATAGPGHPFSFSAEKICTADDKLCINAKGSGRF